MCSSTTLTSLPQHFSSEAAQPLRGKDGARGGTNPATLRGSAQRMPSRTGSSRGCG